MRFPIGLTLTTQWRFKTWSEPSLCCLRLWRNQGQMHDFPDGPVIHRPWPFEFWRIILLVPADRTNSSGDTLALRLRCVVGQFLLLDKKAASALATLVRAVQSRRLTPDPPQGNSMRGIKS